MVQEKNIIRKLHVEIDTFSLASAFYFKDHLDAYFRDEIYPEIEALFEKLQAEIGNEFVRFESIPLEINISNKDSIKDIKPVIISQLKEILTINSGQNLNIKRATYKALDNDANALLFYLEKGRYPWWFSSEKTVDLTAVNKILKSTLFPSKLQRILQIKNVQKRLVYQFDDRALIGLVFAISKVQKQHKVVMLNSAVITEIRLDFWCLIFDQITHKNTTHYVQQLMVLVRRISGNPKSENKCFTIPKITYEQRVLPLINVCNLVSPISIIFQKSVDNIISLQLSKGKSKDQVDVYNQLLPKELKSTELTFALFSEPVAEPKIEYSGLKQINESKENEINTISLQLSEGKSKDQIDVNNPLLPEELKSVGLASEPVAESKIEYSELKQINEFKENDVLVNNAGLVLLHPFLKPLFKNLGFISEMNKIHKEKISEALGVLHFLATKQESPNEHDVLCEKFICDIPFEEAISPIKTLSEKQKAACDELLDAVLSHWPALKTKDIDVLRSEFLTREGKITLEAEKENLFIQRNAVDILLDRLPWSLGIMSLPWKKNIVFLEW